MRLLLSVSEGKEKNYVQAVQRCGAEAVAQYLPGVDTDYDGLILCGGSDIHPKYFGQPICGAVNIDQDRDAAEFALLDAFVKAGKPVLGICRGCQVLGAYFGGTLHQHLKDSADHCSGTGEDLIHEVISLPGSIWEKRYGERFVVNSYHHQAVHTLGPELRAVLWAQDVIEGIEHKSLPILGVQWHPERMSGALARTDTVDGKGVFEYFIGRCKKNMVSGKSDRIAF